MEMVAPKPSFPDARSPRATHRRRQWFDNSLQGNRGVKCSTSLPTTVAHNYARSPSFLLFIYGRLFNFFFPNLCSGVASFFLSFNGRTIYEFTYTAVGYCCSSIVTILCLRKERGLLFFSVGFYRFIDDRSLESINKHKRFLQSIT